MEINYALCLAISLDSDSRWGIRRRMIKESTVSSVALNHSNPLVPEVIPNNSNPALVTPIGKYTRHHRQYTIIKLCKLSRREMSDPKIDSVANYTKRKSTEFEYRKLDKWTNVLSRFDSVWSVPVPMPVFYRSLVVDMCVCVCVLARLNFPSVSIFYVNVNWFLFKTYYFVEMFFFLRFDLGCGHDFSTTSSEWVSCHRVVRLAREIALYSCVCVCVNLSRPPAIVFICSG